MKESAITEVLRDLDELVRSRSILRHPFYVAWTQGRLTRDQLATYAAFYYPHVAAFPGYLRAAAKSAANPAVRQEIERNLADELSHPAPHTALWLNFGEAVGANRTSVGESTNAGATQTVEAFHSLCSSGTGEALAALYAYESQQPEVARTKAAGLRNHYGITDPAALAYFEVHAELDLAHRDGERFALAECLRDGASPEMLLESAGDALDAYWHLLDGVCGATAVPTTC